nr:reverse transcriptase domain-containing protein [Tanacetum cinerariifolium]
MHTRSSSNLPVESPPNPSTFNPKRRNRRRSKQPFILEESPIDTMADQCTMAELLRAPTEGYAKAIVVPSILAEQFELKHRATCRTINLRNEISNIQQRFDESFHEAWDRYKDLLRACPYHGFSKLHQLDTFYNALNPADQDSLNSAAGGNLLERRTQDVLTIIKNKSKFQATPPPAFVKAVEEICVTCGGAYLYYQCLAAGGNTFSEIRDNIQGYVAIAAANYNQGNFVYRSSGSGSLPSNTIANLKGELKAITTRSGIVLDGPSVLIPPSFINSKEDERLEKTLTDQDLAEYTIKDPLHPNIPYPSRMYKQKQQEKDEVQIHKFWQMFKQLHINITLANALILIPKYQKLLKALLSNKEKLLELANTPLNENCSAVILKKLPEKLGDPGKFLILCGFNELKCKALADRGASINLMPLSVWKKLEYEIFYFDIKEKNSGSTTIHADISLSDLESFKFDFKPDPGELTSIVDFGIYENVLSATNVNFSPEEDHSPLFGYVVWILLFFLTYPMVPPNLLSFRNKDTIFDPGIANYHFSSLLLDVSHRCETFTKFNVYPKLLNVSSMEILSYSCFPIEQ